MHYDGKDAGYQEKVALETLTPDSLKKKVAWVNVDSLHDVNLIISLGEAFNIHNLTLEDIVNVDHNPKMEEYDNYLFLTMKMIKPEEKTGNFHVEQISFILMEDLLISFQEHKGDPFDGIRDRVMNGKGKARGRGSDYLLFLLIDAIVDQYLLSLESINNDIDQLELDILENPDQGAVSRIAEQKKSIAGLRKIIYPVRDAIKLITTGDTEFVKDDYFNYYNDVLDHVKHIIDNLDSLRETLTSLMEFYMSQVSNQMNKVMQMLTIIATIFIPLTFLAGIYGMNFQYMPELAWKWSYPLLLGVMLVLGVGMFIYMRKKRWF
jgi:magnesium transporter